MTTQTIYVLIYTSDAAPGVKVALAFSSKPPEPLIEEICPGEGWNYELIDLEVDAYLPGGRSN